MELLTKRAESIEFTGLLNLFEFSVKLNNNELLVVSKYNLIERFPASLNCYDALCMDSKAFEYYFKAIQGALPEVERFRMVQSYTEKTENSDGGDEEESEEEMPSNYKKRLLSHINYTSMTSKEFYEVVGKSPLLTSQEKFENLYLTIK
ncbi:uncharacterized protein LOC108100693 [Drosophila ficusphila]|uniref:uncharacterized protein LOC108100693 n=1 Tax=Drosophila ficusphila TaxID=30025 RepID=UPI0007E74BB1|nr:uncharacterized protein LOC108100693 [Drosophila ficusphila]